MAQPQNPIPQIFGLIPAGSPLLTTPISFNPTTSSFTYHIPCGPTLANPSSRPFTHLSIFLIPQPPQSPTVLPPGKAAAIYVSLSGPAFPEESYKFVGGIGHGKESGVFKIGAGVSEGLGGGGMGGGGTVAVGIAVEDEGIVEGKVEELRRRPDGNSVNGAVALVATGGQGLARTTGGMGIEGTGATTLQLAQRIITNAFNHLASHGQQVGGVEVIPLKAFQNWWVKFEGKIRADPSFLERQQD